MRKTYKYKLKPTPAQERELGRVLGLCRCLYNTALEQRITPGSGARLRPAVSARSRTQRHPRRDAGVRGHPLSCLARCAGAAGQDLSGVLPPREGGQKAGFPRFQGRNRYHSFTYKEFGNGARWTMAFWSCPRSGASPCAGLAHWRGHPRRSRSAREADGWYVCFSCADVPVQPLAAHWTGDGHRPGD